MSDTTDPGLPGADSEVDGATHRGDPLAEQRAMARSAAVVDRGTRGVITVTGPDRLGWLHLLLTQHVSELPADTGTEALVLDVNGRVLHHMVVAHSNDTVYLDTEPGAVPALLDYLQKMVFWSAVEVRDASAELAVLSVVGPQTPAVLAAAGAPVPEQPHGVAPLPEGGLVRRMRWPGTDAADLLVLRAELADWWDRLVDAGARPAGSMAFAALRVEAGRPRLGVDTDDRTIPHEAGWIDSAVHLEKGCYRGQETVARVANLGRPPRQLVLLHLDAGDERLPAAGRPGVPRRPSGRPGGHRGAAPRAGPGGPRAGQAVGAGRRRAGGRCRRAQHPGLDRPGLGPARGHRTAPRPRRPAPHPTSSLIPAAVPRVPAPAAPPPPRQAERTALSHARCVRKCRSFP